MPTVMGCSPRWIFFGDLASSFNPDYKVRAFFLLLDTVKEKSIGLGRNLNVRPLKKSEAYVTKPLINALKIDVSKS